MSRFDALGLVPPVEPMEAATAAHVPEGSDWSYEPKWDGFRCLAFRNGGDVELQSKSGQSLTRYFPETVAAVGAIGASRFVLDGELFVESGAGLDFDALLQRIHPAASRVARLSKETPATYAVFDLLVDEKTTAWYERPLVRRRRALEAFAKRYFGANGGLVVSPATTDASLARAWLAGDVARLDGVVAKRLDAPYAFGRRDAVVKVKRRYTADCVVGGFRLSKDAAVASLLLGLYDGDKLDHIGFVGSMSASERERAGALLRPIVEEPGFTGVAPGGPSRWHKGDEQSPWFPVKPQVVVEVSFDHVTARRFRHAARLLRWRPDKAPRSCTIDQLLEPS
ncbi:MAG TPA: ATP-dependent DNA ligase [Candidatus Tumulicola sp.]|jgi:ATP-dependent DNA ligase